MALSIDMVSDVVCPWCYIGKRRLDEALALRPQVPVEVRFRPFFLNPWVPREGISRADYLTRKWGSVERYRAIAQRVADAAAAEGLPFAADKIMRQPNTLDCHRLILWAGEAGQAACMKQRLMQLYFAEGADLTDPDVLAAAAADCGLDPAAIRSRLATEEDVARVEEEAASASAAGISGVPCFIIGGTIAVEGAKSAQYLAHAIDRAAQEHSGAERVA
jgi:predicted DsbA family dithiol-disulfide isomerase